MPRVARARAGPPVAHHSVQSLQPGRAGPARLGVAARQHDDDRGEFGVDHGPPCGSACHPAAPPRAAPVLRCAAEGLLQDDAFSKLRGDEPLLRQQSGLGGPPGRQPPCPGDRGSAVTTPEPTRTGTAGGTRGGRGPPPPGPPRPPRPDVGPSRSVRLLAGRVVDTRTVLVLSHARGVPARPADAASAVHLKLQLAGADAPLPAALTVDQDRWTGAVVDVRRSVRVGDDRARVRPKRGPVTRKLGLQAAQHARRVGELPVVEVDPEGSQRTRCAAFGPLGPPRRSGRPPRTPLIATSSESNTLVGADIAVRLMRGKCATELNWVPHDLTSTTSRARVAPEVT